ncbi:hypothetical protein PVAG01_10786 [Phlyctema vagabunda]|uniref:Uncharacterized protein n=1 Tax=Phlyctema vagabunda TaxID=108571 RepID=A0ABR4P3D3_9HELO
MPSLPSSTCDEPSDPCCRYKCSIGMRTVSTAYCVQVRLAHRKLEGISSSSVYHNYLLTYHTHQLKSTPLLPSSASSQHSTDSPL